MPNSPLPTPTPPPSAKPNVPTPSPQPVQAKPDVAAPQNSPQTSVQKNITAPIPGKTAPALSTSTAAQTLPSVNSNPTGLPVKQSLTQATKPMGTAPQLAAAPKPVMTGTMPGKPALKSPPGLAKQNTPPIPAKPSSPAPIMAAAKKSPIKALPFIGGAILVVILVIFVISKMLGGGTDGGKTTDGGSTPVKSGKEITLTYWGLWEEETAFEQAFADFEKENPGVTIVYKKQSPTDYRERLQTEISTGTGPDIFRFHASWVPMLSEELAVMPSKVMNSSDYQSAFYPIAADQLQLNGQFVGIPLMYDGLVLLYNKDILETAGVEPPSTWPELQTMAKELTVPANRSSTRDIQRAGLAIGNATNVDHFSDILGLLILQNGGDPSTANTKQVQEALTYYTQFMRKDMVWSEALPNSTVAFAREEVAMIFAPSWRIHEIQALNPDLNFGVSTVPQLGDDRIAWASYWAEGVNSKSKNQEMAWELLLYLSDKEVMQENYSEQSQNRAFGEIYSRVDLADSVSSDELIAPFLEDAPYADNWYLNSMTHDKGINDDLIQYYKDAITEMLENNADAEDVTETIDMGTKQILRQFGLSK